MKWKTKQDKEENNIRRERERERERVGRNLSMVRKENRTRKMWKNKSIERERVCFQ